MNNSHQVYGWNHIEILFFENIRKKFPKKCWIYLKKKVMRAIMVRLLVKILLFFLWMLHRILVIYIIVIHVIEFCHYTDEYNLISQSIFSKFSFMIQGQSWWSYYIPYNHSILKQWSPMIGVCRFGLLVGLFCPCMWYSRVW